MDWLNAVDESVRGQLHELNETNWKRLRTELHARDARLDTRFADLLREIDTRFAQIDTRFIRIDGRFTQTDALFGAQESRFEAKLESRLGEFHSSLVRWMVGLWLSTAAATILTIIGLKLV